MCRERSTRNRTPTSVSWAENFLSIQTGKGKVGRIRYEAPPTPWLFVPTKRTDDRAEYCLDCSFLPQCKHQVLVFTLEWSGAGPNNEISQRTGPLSSADLFSCLSEKLKRVSHLGQASLEFRVPSFELGSSEFEFRVPTFELGISLDPEFYALPLRHSGTAKS